MGKAHRFKWKKVCKQAHSLEEKNGWEDIKILIVVISG